jgi:transposase InsO family protein
MGGADWTRGWTAAAVAVQCAGESQLAGGLCRDATANGELFWVHALELACARNDIDHRTTKVKHPWTNGQVERMNRTIKDATVRCYHYESHDQLRRHLTDFVSAYNFGRRLKALKGPLTSSFAKLGFPTRPILYQSAPPNAGTKHLASWPDLRAPSCPKGSLRAT